MSMNWKQRLAHEPALQDVSNWPLIEVDQLDARRRTGFIRNQRIVAAVLAGRPLVEVARQFGFSTPWVTQLLQRCLGGDPEEAPRLTAGLIPYRHGSSGNRNRPLPTLASPSGSGRAFLSLLEQVPGLKDALDRSILADLKDSPGRQNLKPAGFHGEFKRCLREAQWPTDCYPYTTQTLASESCRRYFHQRRQTLQLAMQRTYKLPPATTRRVVPLRRALRCIQIDEHLLDMQNSISLEFNDEMIPLRLARASALVAVDVDTECVLGHLLTPTRHPNQDDLLALLNDCQRPWEPLVLNTPGLSYRPGACYPSGLPDGIPIIFDRLQLDNALMHSAGTICDYVCRQTGATLSFGRPGQPKVRHLIERVFRHIADQCHRFDETTGASPTDPVKESKKKRDGIPPTSWRTLEEVLSVLLTAENTRPRAHLGNASPIDLFREHCTAQFVRHTPPHMQRQWRPFEQAIQVPLHWYPHEQRRPFFNLAYCRYSGEHLHRAVSKSAQVTVRFDRRDIRRVQVLGPQGQDLGYAYAPKSWQRFPHSMATRKRIHQLVKAGKLQAADLLSAYFHHLLMHKDSPTKALLLLATYREFTQDGGQGLALAANERPPSAHLTAAPRNALPAWSPSLVTHRRPLP